MTEQETAPHAEALSDLVGERYGLLVGYARKRLAALDVPPAWVDAEDVVQNALASVLGRAEPIEQLRPYVFVVIKNEVRHAARRYRSGLGYGSRDVDVQLEAADPAIHPCDAADLRLDVQAALCALPPQQRAAAFCTKVLGLTQEDTAAVMKTAPGTVGTHVSRAMVALRVTLGALGVALVAWSTAWMAGEMKEVIPAAGWEKVEAFDWLKLVAWMMMMGFVAAVWLYMSAPPEEEARTWWQRLGVSMRQAAKEWTDSPWDRPLRATDPQDPAIRPHVEDHSLWSPSRDPKKSARS
ncbi:sigma-70 family RNA polymerase sigma factor [Streptomyces sp. NPDC059862]|uniref:sigma-70 family RNA polymerase sigma factor n=1 Tax=Streptomyces sp. NPDC059862 TaxID=3346975 RepID=UPI003669C29B